MSLVKEAPEMTFRPVLLLSVALLVGCAAPANPLGQWDAAADDHAAQGLVREGGTGPFVAGAVEHFHALYDVEAVRQARWSASAGALETRGDHVTWTLPGAGEASLSLLLSMIDGTEVTSRW